MDGNLKYAMARTGSIKERGNVYQLLLELCTASPPHSQPSHRSDKWQWSTLACQRGVLVTPMCQATHFPPTPPVPSFHILWAVIWTQSTDFRDLGEPIFLIVYFFLFIKAFLFKETWKLKKNIKLHIIPHCKETTVSIMVYLLLFCFLYISQMF